MPAEGNRLAGAFSFSMRFAHLGEDHLTDREAMAGEDSVEERLLRLEAQVDALTDAVEELARGLGDGPTADPLAHAAQAGRRAHELLLLARSASQKRPQNRPTAEEGGFAMTTAQDIMHTGAECIGEHQTLQHAARRMRDLDVGALPICGDDDRLHGMITDRDIVTLCVAGGADPATVTAGQLAKGPPVTVNSTADVSDVLRLMEEHQIRRLPVLDSGRVVGMISEADLARHLPEQSVGQFVEAVCAR
jgi:CBS domain-containing protein